MIATFFANYISFLTFVPFLLLAYLPMKGKLVNHKQRIMIYVGIMVSFLPMLDATLVTYFPDLFLPVTSCSLILLYLMFYQSVRYPKYKSISVYLVSTVLLCFSYQFANIFVDLLAPSSRYFSQQLFLALFFFCIMCLFTLCYGVLFFRYFSKLLASLYNKKLWKVNLLVPACFLLLQVLSFPSNMLFFDWKPIIYLLFSLVLLALFSLLYFFFYFTVIELEQSATAHNSQLQTIARNRLFTQQQKLMEEINQLNNSYTEYCHLSQLNTVLNYYKLRFQNSGIQTDWKITLPDSLTIPPQHLCCILCELLENVYQGCSTVNSTSQRYHRMTIHQMHQVTLYISSINSFAGPLRLENNHYLSTNIHKDGYGLKHICQLASLNAGNARFHNTETEFYADIAVEL